MYFILNDVRLKETIEFFERHHLSAGVTTEADFETAKGIETHDHEGEAVKLKESEDVSQIWNYFPPLGFLKKELRCVY